MKKKEPWRRRRWSRGEQKPRRRSGLRSRRSGLRSRISLLSQQREWGTRRSANVSKASARIRSPVSLGETPVVTAAEQGQEGQEEHGLAAPRAGRARAQRARAAATAEKEMQSWRWSWKTKKRTAAPRATPRRWAPGHLSVPQARQAHPKPNRQFSGRILSLPSMWPGI